MSFRFYEDALPEYFTNWDPMTPENQAALSCGYDGLPIRYIYYAIKYETRNFYIHIFISH